MKITKTAAQAQAERQREQNIMQRASVCPCCGERKDAWDYMQEGIPNKGVMVGGIIITHSSLFRHYRAYACECLTCGAEWESDPL